MSTNQTPAEAAEQIRGRFNEYRDRITSDRSLSDEGRQAAIATAAETANGSIRSLQAKVDSDRAAERARLEKKLLAPSAGWSASEADRLALTSSFRDVLARAGATADSDELLGMQNTARLVGDSLLEKATFVVAMERGDARVVNGWTSSHREHEADADRLFEMRTTSPTLREVLSQASTFMEVS